MSDIHRTEPATAADGGEEAGRALRSALAPLGICVVETEDDLDDVYDGRGRRGRCVVVVADANDPRRTSLLLRAVRSVDPACHLLVVHGSDDAVSAWEAVRHGAHPFPAHLHAAAQVHDGLVASVADRCAALRRGAPAHRADAAAIAQEALRLAVDERPVEAAVLLASITEPVAAAAAVDALTDQSVCLLERIRDRSRYPVDVALVMARLDTPTGGDAGLAFTMLQRAALRCAGLRIDLEELVVSHGASRVLVAMVQSTLALVRLSAERRWRTPRAFYDEVTGASGVEAAEST